MDISIVICLLCIIVTMVITVLTNSRPIRLLYYLVGILITMFMMIFISQEIDKQYPSAMDVYQGKTTLQYTYRDSVKVDSVVVFKERK